MDIKTLEEKLLALNKDIGDIFEEIDYKNNHKLDNVTYNKESLDECMLYNEFGSLFTHLDFINALMNYLHKPVIQEGTICSNEKGGYNLNDIPLNRKDIVEIICYDEINKVFFWKPLIVKDHTKLDGKQARKRDI